MSRQDLLGRQCSLVLGHHGSAGRHRRETDGQSVALRRALRLQDGPVFRIFSLLRVPRLFPQRLDLLLRDAPPDGLPHGQLRESQGGKPRSAGGLGAPAEARASDPADDRDHPQHAIQQLPLFRMRQLHRQTDACHPGVSHKPRGYSAIDCCREGTFLLMGLAEYLSGKMYAFSTMIPFPTAGHHSGSVFHASVR